MKKIKEFATLCGTSSKTLRFYDRIGLLEADYTDPETGYRYYDDSQKAKYTVISLFKEIGFTLDEIKNDILGCDEDHRLAILRKKESELENSLSLCRIQIASLEESIRRKKAIESGCVFLTRYDDACRIELSSGKETRIFTCPKESMDICAEVMEELFCSPVFVNLELSDLEMSDNDRDVLIQTAEGTPEEIMNLDLSELFGNGEELRGIRSVLLMMKFPPDGDSDDMIAIAESVRDIFPQDCTVIWGVSFSESPSARAKLCIACLY